MEKSDSLQKKYINSKTNQIRLAYYKLKVSKPSAQLCIIHGLGQYAQRFQHIALHFQSIGFNVHLIDLRGFGYSGGGRGCSKVQDMEKDLSCLIQQTDGQLPLFFYAHSMGGLITVSFLLRNPQLRVAGVILTSPLLGPPLGKQVTWAKLKILEIIGDQLQELVINSLINPTALTKSNSAISKIFSDRLMIPFLGLGMAKSLITNAFEILNRVSSFRYPVLIFHGQKDSVTNIRDSKKFIQRISSTCKQFITFPQGYHQLQHDQQCKELLNQSSRFYTSLLKAGPLTRGALPIFKFKQQQKIKRNWLRWLIISFFIFMVLKYRSAIKYLFSINKK